MGILVTSKEAGRDKPAPDILLALEKLRRIPKKWSWSETIGSVIFFPPPSWFPRDLARHRRQGLGAKSRKITYCLDWEAVGREIELLMPKTAVPPANQKRCGIASVPRFTFPSQSADKQPEDRVFWRSMQIIIPMSGRGSRFAKAGYDKIKPLIEVDGHPMIEHVIGLFPGSSDFLFICAEDHLRQTNLRSVLNRIAPKGRIKGIEPHKKGTRMAGLAGLLRF